MLKLSSKERRVIGLIFAIHFVWSLSTGVAMVAAALITSWTYILQIADAASEHILIIAAIWV